MRLSKLHVRHYKSIDDAQIKFSERITVLVGPNAAGKSNVVDSLRFVRDAVAIDLEHAIAARGGIARVRQYSKTKPYKVTFSLACDPDHEESRLASAEYELSIESLSASNYVVDHEKAVVISSSDSDATSKLTQLDRNKQGVASGGKGSDRQIKVAPDQLAVSLARTPSLIGLWPLERYVRDWRFSSIYPNRLRDPSTPDRDSVLAEDGRNWASVIKALRRTLRGRSAIERINEAMRSIIPSFEDVVVKSVGSYLVPHFIFRLKGKDTVTFDPVQLSDGTLRIFGILLALNQVPAPKLLVIEEPEQTIHPGVLGVLADAFREASENTQIVITTHSPHLVDYFEPEHIRVVQLDKGVTRVAQVKRSQVEAVKRRLMSLEEFMKSEGLQPEDE